MRLGARLRCPRLGDRGQAHHGEPTGELALRVYVEKKKPKTKVDNPVPKVVAVPGVGDRITDVIELGKVVPELFTERVRPAMPGSGLGHTAVTVGTFGCLVRKKGDADGLYVLSNSHVLANEGMALPGDGILQPARSMAAAPTETPSPASPSSCRSSSRRPVFPISSMRRLPGFAAAPQ